MKLHTIGRQNIIYVFTLGILLFQSVPDVFAAYVQSASPTNNYCAVPPYIAQTVPPLTMIVAGKDQKLWNQAYSDAADLTGNGKLDITYDNSIDYFGYFDSYKCYSYSTSSGVFTPANTTANKFCTSTQWSGNILNWITMSRMDVLRDVLYGGHRVVDNASNTAGSTILQRAYIPMDGHAWGKQWTGRLCNSGSTYTNSCSINSDCDTGYTCVDIETNGNYLVPFTTPTAPSTCTASATTSTVPGNILVARYQHPSSESAANIQNSNEMVASYAPANLFNPVPTSGSTTGSTPYVALTSGASSNVNYVTGFDDASLNPTDNYADNYNIFATTQFTPDVSGTWTFGLDSDDSSELQIGAFTGGTTVVNFYGAHGPSGGANNTGTINLTAGNTYNIVVRHFEQTGGEGVRIWFMRPPGTYVQTASATGGGAAITASRISITSGKKSDAQTICNNATASNGIAIGFVLSGGNRGNCSNSHECYCTPPKALTGYTESRDSNYNFTYVPVVGIPPAPAGYTYEYNSSGIAYYYPTNSTGCNNTSITATSICTPTAFTYVSSSSATTGASVGPYAPLDLTAPLIDTGNECAIETTSFIQTGTPSSGVTVVTGVPHQHLFCNSSLTSGGTPLLRVMTNMTNPVSDWSAKERPECNDLEHSYGSGPYPFTTDPTDYNVKVSVCNPNLLESNCRAYGPTPIYKPAGLLQQYGEGDGSKVCSRTYSVSCPDSDCTSNGGGTCIYKAPMYFGLISGSYANNLNGGVLRKNISSILNEVNVADGTFIPSTDGIIQTFEQIQEEGYNYNDYAYDNGGVTGTETCGWLEGGPLQNGNCQNWGNPLAEMMYESLRYFAGKNAPTTAFKYSGTTTDSLLGLPAPAWGFTNSANSTVYKPYDIYPTCSRPFMLVLSDINPSYDGDQIPGSTYSTVTEDTNTPTLGLGATVSGKSVLNTLVDTIGTNEGINNKSWFVGQSGTNYDTLCTSKSVANLSTVRGICPLEPTKQGTYYSSALAYFGKTGFKTATGLPPISTYAVAISPPFANISIQTSLGTIALVPTAKSISGSYDVYSACAANSNLTWGATNGLTVTAKNSNQFCPTNQVVNYFVDSVKYDTNNNITYVEFRINFEDSEQGADYDMDTIIQYEVCTQTAIDNGYGTCGNILTPLNSSIQINVNTLYGAGSIDQIAGFTISGTTTDGVYLVVKDGDVPDSANATTPAVVAGMPYQWSKVFTPNGTTTDFMHDPLWYAAKWGGFIDSNAPTDAASLATYVPKPDLRNEWAKNCTATDISKCDPDNYFLVTNPLQLKTQLNKALTSILSRVSSGTASSILNSSQGSGANLLQAVFYPQKTFDNSTSVNWTGEMQNLWYYLDPNLNNSTVRVDTNSDYSLDLDKDYIAHFRFDDTQNQTVVDLIKDVNGNMSSLTNVGTYNTDDPNVKSLWRAGKLLWQRNVTSAGDPRNIYTVTGAAPGSTLTRFQVDGAFDTLTSVQTLLQAASTTEADAIINYTLGIDQPASSYRARKVTLLSCGLTDSLGCTREWKLGDIINSTPKLESTMALQTYNQPSPFGYGDTSYAAFSASSNYQKHGMAYVGANDGMLHAFKLGILDVSGQTRTHKATMRDIDGSVATINSNLGREEWAFIPRNTLPYLKYLADPDYAHIFSVDLTTTLVDASINVPTDNPAAYPNCSASTYWNCRKETATSGGALVMGATSWRTILIGGSGTGGASQNLYTTGTTANPCVDLTASGTCVKTPIDGVGYSSYFALDVTNPETLPGGSNPINFLWEFNGDPAHGNYLGYATSGPAIVRIGNSATGNVTSGSNTSAVNTNGRWFAVFASGPTGPIDTSVHEFQGTSNQSLKIFVVDLATGNLITTIDTHLSNAFAGSITGGVIDVDKGKSGAPGFYSDDAIYIGYVQKDTTAGTWTKGGVLRLLTNEKQDPTKWTLAPLISGIGPVTTSITKLQDRNANSGHGNLWIYFGTGRYYYKSDTLGGQFSFYGVKDPCYGSQNGSFYGPANDYDLNNNVSGACTNQMTETNLTNQSGTSTTAPSTNLPAGSQGWYNRLDSSTANVGFSAERVVTAPVSSTAGAVYFTTFMPTADICGYGGNTNIWAVNYATGAAPSSAAMQGEALVQTSTGAMAEISLSNAFSNPGNSRYDKRRTSTTVSGMPPSGGGLGLITRPKPARKILHYQEN